MKLLIWIDKIPWAILIVGAILLALAPFTSQPHLIEKLTMLLQGSLTKPMDVFDLLFHASLPILLVIKMVRRLL